MNVFYVGLQWFVTHPLHFSFESNLLTLSIALKNELLLCDLRQIIFFLLHYFLIILFLTFQKEVSVLACM